MEAFMTRLRCFSTLGLLTFLSTASLAGCGGGDDAGGGTGAFIGMWQYTSGTSNTSCPMIGVNETSQLAGEKVPIAKGIDSPLVYSETNTNCSWKMNVSGNVATIISGQSCTFMDNGVSFTGTYSAGTFTITGTTGQFSGTANAMANVNGSIVNCSITGNGGLSKITN
jgi:hypothetical protein